MMEASPISFDLSSDYDETISVWKEPKWDDYNWLSEVLETVDKVFDDPDEVLVVGEVNPTKKSKSPNSVARKVADEDDGDCVVLEGDPDKALSDVNDLHEDSDECLIVGQKGQIACRDYPHPRHDCARFPFSSTSHEQYCELCHCFVCDLKAPCSYWGSGTRTTDHCHATDKEERWKNMRKTSRHARKFPIPVTKAPVISHSTAIPRLNQAPCDDTQFTLQNQVSRLILTQAARNQMPQTHIQQPSLIRARSSSRCRVPYNPSVGSQRVLNRTMHPHPVSHQLHGVHNTVIRRDRGTRIRNLGPQFVSSNTLSKRMEAVSTMNRTAYVPSENITSSIALQHQQNPSLLTVSSERNPNPICWPNLCSGSTLGANTHQKPGMGSVTNNSASSRSSAFGQPVPQSSLNQDTNHLQNQNQQAMNHVSDYDLNWVNNTGECNQQPSVGCSQIQSFTNEKEASEEVNEGDKSVFNELESFLFNDQSFPEESLAELSSLSANHMSYDTGMIFFDVDIQNILGSSNSCITD
ncbi:uncharacterized protein LOC120133186 [Hibiscus syriacus]|uniref:uncharacterized protein LOC120133186 n=1 Tax=Hibiscus syriacus TaxID=106335 RepID=UPI001923AFA4|nr:uncharacterized protein LOC120133186 [Hibiscus syriacus]XP_039005763.1 uncharacterized protein LOC120133186 [Hibiscus syriacus]